MNLQLHPDLETFIREQLTDSSYRSPEEVVTEALYVLWERDQEQPAVTPQNVASLRWWEPLEDLASAA
jgi:Arc/MetJ-type ribon-helix-helix transcriptional regulator